MKQIRRGVFETNSSSVHSITMCMKSDYDKWVAGEFYWDRWNHEFVSKEHVDKFIEEVRNDFRDYEPDYIQGDEEWEKKFLRYLNDDNQYYSCERFNDEIEYEGFFEEFTTPSGDAVISFGYYGNDY